MDVCLGLCSLHSAEEKHSEFLNTSLMNLAPIPSEVFMLGMRSAGLFVLFILSLIHQICGRYLLCARFL